MPHERENIIIRAADVGDAVAISALAEQLGYPTARMDVEERLTVILGRRDNAVFLAKREGKVVGWAHVLGQAFLESPPFAELAGLIVDRDTRRLGIGRCLVEVCVRWARDHRFGQIRVRSNVLRSEAHPFYSSVGFTQIKSQAVFAMALPCP
jgi:GNAT superfamily N-acetyltransferase